MRQPGLILRRAPVPATVVAVGSGKGGVGTSTVAALLAATMAADGVSVLLVDAGHRFGALHHLLGLEPVVALSELRGGRRDAGDMVLPVSHHLSLLATSEEGSLSPTERRLMMRRIAGLYHSYSLVVIDAGSTAESLLGACRDSVSRLLAVSAADRISLVATYAVVKLMHEQLPGLRVDVIGNRVDEESAARMHEYVNGAAVRFLGRTVPFGGTVPDDPDFGRVLAAGMGTEEAATGSSASQAARAIGGSLLSAVGKDGAPAGGEGGAPFLRLIGRG
ncbi:MAG: nucleotide-binding protein [Gemmatimonadota bacterium]